MKTANILDIDELSCILISASFYSDQLSDMGNLKSNNNRYFQLHLKQLKNKKLITQGR